MAKIAYHRLADALVSLLEVHSAAEVAASAAEHAKSKGVRLDLERLVPEVERALFERYGHAVVHVTAARELSLTVTDLAAADLAKALGSKTHEVINEIDPSIVGGVIAEAAGRQRDRSVRRKLQYIGVHHG